jgi:Cu(I)/Ag(I) efflux system membrane fusion protein/cobalt-zinc-cadmium efflux system membrane fusion protein
MTGRDPSMPGTGPADTSPATPRAEVQIDARRQQLTGVRTVTVDRRPLSMSTRTVGVVRYDETRLSDVNLKLSGWIEELFVDYTGRFVEHGQPLFTLYSPELVTTQNEYLLAIDTRATLAESQVPDARRYADRLVDAARQRLALWDLPADQIAALETSRTPQRTMVFRSPVSGFVIEKHVLQGMHVTPGTSLYTVADLSRIWVEADVYEQELARVRVGTPAAVTVDAYPGERVQGRVIHVYPYADERTRTVKVRLDLPNPGNRLKPGLFANVELETAIGSGLVIPVNALLDSGAEQVVFVAKGDGYFEPRPVRVGHRLGDAVQILDGLTAGERVASGAAFLIDSESQLRAALQGFQVPPAAGVGSAGPELAITFRTQPDPPRTGSNQLEVTVRDPDGQPIADAAVTVVFYMAPMPSMNMPAMRNEAALTHAGGGTYRGAGEILMGGRWDVTVTTMRNGARLGSRTFTVVAR